MWRHGFAPLDHRIGVRLGQGSAGQLAGCAAVGLKENRLRFGRESRTVDILMEVGVRDCDGTAWRAACRLSRASAPRAAGSAVHVLNTHADGRADAGEGIDHEAGERAVAQADDGRDIDSVE